MKKNILKILVVGITCILFITACGLRKEEVRSSNVKEENQTRILQSTIKKLEEDNIKEENYLFFNEAEESKIMTLTFHANYNEQPIVNATLYQDGELVSDKIRVIDNSIHDKGQFTIALKEYVPSFNEIELKTDQNQILMLKTGQYNFERVNIENSIPDNERWSIVGYNTGEKGSSFTFNASYTREKKGESNYEIFLTQSSIEKLKIEETHSKQEQEKNLELTVHSNSLKKFQNPASYEMMIIQTNKRNEKHLMNTILIVIEPNE